MARWVMTNGGTLPLFHVLIAVTIVCHVHEKLVFFSSLLTSRWCNSIWWCSPGAGGVSTSFCHCHLLCPGYCRHCLCCGMPHIQLHLQEQKVCCYIKCWFIHHHHHHHHHHSYVWRKLHNRLDHYLWAYVGVSMYHCLYSLHSVPPQTHSSQQLPPELHNRVWSSHHVHDYLFPHHPYHWSTWCGCTMHCRYIIDAANLSPLANLHCAP